MSNLNWNRLSFKKDNPNAPSETRRQRWLERQANKWLNMPRSERHKRLKQIKSDSK